MKETLKEIFGFLALSFVFVTITLDMFLPYTMWAMKLIFWLCAIFMFIFACIGIRDLFKYRKKRAEGSRTPRTWEE